MSMSMLHVGNLAPTVFSLSRRWFDRFVDPVMIDGHDYRDGAVSPSTSASPLTPRRKLNAAIAAAEKVEEKEKEKGVARGETRRGDSMSCGVHVRCVLCESV